MTDIHNSANRTQAYCSPLDDVLMIHVVENVGNKFCWKYAHAACCDARQLCHTKGCIVTWLGPSNQFRSHVTYIFSLTPSLQLLFSSNFWCAKGGTPCGGLLTLLRFLFFFLYIACLLTRSSIGLTSHHPARMSYT